ncbi:MAG TPA: DUF4245 domain-containing protein [Micromonosporaceae bacterium]|nr:DUF4245 domain-containing protein [Micromonosporaceae bacterium]
MPELGPTGVRAAGPGWEDGGVKTVPPTEHASDDPNPAGLGENAPETPTRRSERSAKDMALSLLVLLVPIALVFGFYNVVLDGDKPGVIDPGPTVALARADNAFPVSEPTGLDAGWHPIRADFRRVDGGQTLRIGYVTPANGGVQLVQSNVPAERLLPAELTERGRPEGVVELAGRSWQRYTARPGERALVLLEPDRTVIVVGSAAESELRHLAAKID